MSIVGSVGWLADVFTIGLQGWSVPAMMGNMSAGCSSEDGERSMAKGTDAGDGDGPRFCLGVLLGALAAIHSDFGRRRWTEERCDKEERRVRKS